jgi:hypothetical protein
MIQRIWQACVKAGNAIKSIIDEEIDMLVFFYSQQPA